MKAMAKQPKRNHHHHYIVEGKRRGASDLFGVPDTDSEPVQFDNPQAWSPEQRLLAAVLQRRLDDIGTPHADVAWFRSQSLEPFSFLFVVQHLNLEHSTERIRTKVLTCHD